VIPTQTIAVKMSAFMEETGQNALCAADSLAWHLSDGYNVTYTFVW